MLITTGVAYSQLIEDVRAIVRHELQQTPAPAAISNLIDDLLSVREAADVMGVTVQTIHTWKQNGTLKYYKMGSRTYLKRADVLAALKGYQRTNKAGKGAGRG